ncbi:hypothetical protein BJY00DRAFT_319399 [Aspergillus carlsbadensis]|nr:hypothetical protein BJY00DRAFT_319399 [Aspergillus carlsbadensis]
MHKLHLLVLNHCAFFLLLFYSALLETKEPILLSSTSFAHDAAKYQKHVPCQASYHAPILDLPDEILLMIFSTLHDEHGAIARRTLCFPSTALTQRTLHTLTLTTRRFHRLSQPLLYRTTVISASFKHLYPRLVRNPHLAAEIRNLVLFEERDCESGYAHDRIHEASTARHRTRRSTTEARDSERSRQDHHYEAYLTCIPLLVSFLVLLKRLRFFRYVADADSWLRSEGGVLAAISEYLAAFEEKLLRPESTSTSTMHLFHSIGKLDLAGYAPSEWEWFLRNATTLPRLKSLRCTVPTSAEDWYRTPHALQFSIPLPPNGVAALNKELESLEDEEYWRRHASPDSESRKHSAGFMAYMQSLQGLTLTSWQLYHATQPFLYRTVWIFSIGQLRTLLERISSEPDRASYIRGIIICMRDPAYVAVEGNSALVACPEGRTRNGKIYRPSNVGPVNELMRPLENAVERCRSKKASNWRNMDARIKAVALALMELLVRCKKLRFLRYLAGYRLFDRAFRILMWKTTCLFNNGPSCGFFQGLGDITVAQSTCRNSLYIALFMDLAKGRALNLHQLPPPSKGHQGSCEELSSRLRCLTLTASAFDPATVSAILTSVSDLHVLRYDIDYDYHTTGRNYLRKLQSAIDSHKESLVELAITANTVPLFSYLWMALRRLRWSFADYPNLTKLDVLPHLVLPLVPAERMPPLHLPPRIEFLTVGHWHFRQDAHAVLEWLIAGVDRFPTLKMVTVRPRQYKTPRVTISRSVRKRFADALSPRGIEIRFE